MEIQNAQALSKSSKSGDKRTYVWAKAKRTCVLLAIGVFSMSSKSADKRTYVWAKAKSTCVLLAIGVFSMSSKSADKRTYVWAKAKRTCVILAIGAQEREIQNAQANFIKVRNKKKKVICAQKHFNINILDKDLVQTLLSFNLLRTNMVSYFSYSFQTVCRIINW